MLSFTDRYFTHKYYVDVMKKPDEDMRLLVHSNGICVLTLAPSHPVIRRSQNGMRIKSIDYKVTGKLDRSQNKVCGKSKRGAQFLVPDATVCRILLTGESGDSIYTIRACIKGRLIEVNDRLTSEPTLLTTNPDTSGYICVILPQVLKRVGDESDQKEGSKNSFPFLDRKSYLDLRFPGNHDEAIGMPVTGSGSDGMDE